MPGTVPSSPNVDELDTLRKRKCMNLSQGGESIEAEGNRQQNDSGEYASWLSQYYYRLTASYIIIMGSEKFGTFRYTNFRGLI